MREHLKFAMAYWHNMCAEGTDMFGVGTVDKSYGTDDPMEQAKIDRINELARKSKEQPLSPEEAAEQKALREEYIAEFRASFGGILANTVVQYPDGSRRSLEDIKNDKQKKE